MDSEQLLQAISDMIDKKLDEKLDQKLDQKLKPVYNRLDMMEAKQDRAIRKLDNLQLDVKIAERNIKEDIHTLQDEMETVIEVLKQHEMIPQ